MGAKPPAKLKLRRPMYKCNICDRKLLSAQALKTHLYCIHEITKTNINDSNSVTTKKGQVAIKKGVVKAKMKTAKAGNITPSRSPPIEEPWVTDVRRIQFECPKCPRLFSVYFSAYRHIQKYHCVNSRGVKVPSNSPDLIKPIRIEFCVKCNKPTNTEGTHSCCDDTIPPDIGTGQRSTCTGCEQQFSTIQLFDLHVSRLHSDGVESMFFPHINEFFMWKNYVEQKTEIKYLILGKCNSKQTYRCTYLPKAEPTDNSCLDDETTAQFCPSSIIVQEYSKGIQVHFYKEHYGHRCPKYALPQRFKRYSITPLMIQSPDYEYTTDIDLDEKDLYIQFKTLMESIVLETAKVKVDTLKVLVGKALEMSSVLTNYQEDDEMSSPTTMTNKAMTDDQITTALERFQKALTRKTDGEDFHNDSKDGEQIMSPLIVNAFSMAETNEQDAKKNDSSAKTKIILNQLRSYNDSYKDFLETNLRKKCAAKHKKSTDVHSTVTLDSNDDLLKPIKSEPVDEAKPVEIKESAKNTDNKRRSSNILNKPIKKKIMKTKIGQFKPSLSPRKSTDSNASRKSIGQVVDLKYEIKEQEDDCNILILKM